jgi:hypothetical protein
MGWTIGILGFDSRRGLRIFLFTTASRTALEPTQPPIQWVPGVLSLGVKRPRREADHSPPSRAKVKKAWSYTSTPQYVFMAWCLVKNRNNFTLNAPTSKVRTTLILVRFMTGAYTGSFTKIGQLVFIAPFTWCGLLERLLMKKSPAFYGTRRFITVFTRARH